MNRVYQGASICVYFDEKQVQRKKRRILAPGEMEQIAVAREALEGQPGLGSITIAIEEDA